MKTQSKSGVATYILFHANLAFSSIEVEDREIVIDRVYFSLLELIEKNHFIKVGLEISGFTLEIIKKLRPSWIKQCKKLCGLGKIEIIASGYMQIIGPLVPYEVNLKNQTIGLKTYENILGIKPSLAYVNEQVLSASLVDLYANLGFEALMCEWNNVHSLKLSTQETIYNNQPIYLKGMKSRIPVIWTDSILFQQFQRVAHFQLTLDDHINFLSNYLNSEAKVFPLYSSDLEIFNYRPGRFKNENQILGDEWQRVKEIISTVNKQFKIILPSEALRVLLNVEIFPFSSKFPILVKKQDKYSLSRWAACGRDASHINTLCTRLFKSLDKTASPKEWKDLLIFWGSDYRTHTTPKRWYHAVKFLEKKVAPYTNRTEQRFFRISKPEEFQIKNGKLIFEKDDLQIVFLLNKGLALQTIQHGQKYHPVCTIWHGTFSNISYAADFFTGSCVLSSSEYGNLSDLSEVSNINYFKASGREFKISATVDMASVARVEKIWTIDLDQERLFFQVNLELLTDFTGSIRLGTLTSKFENSKLWYETHNGGEIAERFYITENLEQHKPISLHQSSSSGFGATHNGKFKFGTECGQQNVDIQIEQDKFHPFLMMQTYQERDKFMTRLFFSVNELDDTSVKKRAHEFSAENKLVAWNIKLRN